MTPEAKCFLQLAARHRLASTQDLSCLVRRIPSDIGLPDLAQRLVDQGLVHDFSSLHGLLDEARSRARTQDGLPGQVPGGQPTWQASSLGAACYFPGLGDGLQLSAEDAVSVLTTVLTVARRVGASDVHITAGHLPTWRRWGVLREISENAVTAEAALALNTALLPVDMAQAVHEGRDTTGAIVLADGTRYRVNVVTHHLGTAGTFHIVPAEVPNLVELGFHNAGAIERLLDFHNGIILICGPAGCGRTTTLAALVQALGQKRMGHIVTIEDPVEIVHAKDGCVVSQRAVGQHTATYASALRAALREDPDIIVVGEMHDFETTALALTAAETGHLVLSTLHTMDAASALNRLLSVFPPSQAPQVRATVSESLRGIICQQLLPAPDGRPVLAWELLINTPAVSHLIRDGKTYHLEPVMQTGLSEGMQTLDRSILDLVRRGLLSVDTARSALRSRQSIDELAQRGEPARPAAPTRPALTRTRRYLNLEGSAGAAEPSDRTTGDP